MSDSLTFKVAQVAGVLLSALNAGALFAVSILTIPMMILPARRLRQTKTETGAAFMSQIKQQWLWIFNKGKAMFPPVGLAATLAYSYLAYALWSDNIARWYIVAAASTLSVAPFTLLLMTPTYDRLEQLAKGAKTTKTVKRESQKSGAADEKEDEKAKQEDDEDEEFLGLLMKWARWNSVRALLPLTGAVIGLTAALH